MICCEQQVLGLCEMVFTQEGIGKSRRIDNPVLQVILLRLELSLHR